jgi:hypothetical protein
MRADNQHYLHLSGHSVLSDVLLAGSCCMVWGLVVGNPWAMAEGMLTIVIGRICKHYESKKGRAADIKRRARKEKSPAGDVQGVYLRWGMNWNNRRATKATLLAF